MITREILNSHPVTALRKEISKTNIKGYSKMTKAQVVDVMMKNKEKFSHIKKKDKGIDIKVLFEGAKAKTKAKKAPAPAPKKKEEPKKAPTPKKKEEPKKLASKWSYSDVVDDNDPIFLFRAEDSFEESATYSNIDWITGITPKMNSFYRNNVNNANNLSKKDMFRLETIEEKIRENLRPSLVKDLKKRFKKWQSFPDGKKYTLKEAIKDFEEYYF
jgi:ribosomal protein L12E/L44/L45/RPP1/RPP2